jgi:hypothetical protein
MAEDKKIRWKEYLLKGLYYDLVGSPEGMKLMKQFQEQRKQDKYEKLHKKQLAQQEKERTAQKEKQREARKA